MFDLGRHILVLTIVVLVDPVAGDDHHAQGGRRRDSLADGPFGKTGRDEESLTDILSVEIDCHRILVHAGNASSLEVF